MWLAAKNVVKYLFQLEIFYVKLIIIVGHGESVYFPVLCTNAHVLRSLAAK